MELRIKDEEYNLKLKTLRNVNLEHELSQTKLKEKKLSDVYVYCTLMFTLFLIKRMTF